MSKTRDELAAEILCALITSTKFHLANPNTRHEDVPDTLATNTGRMFAIIRKRMDQEP